MTPPRTFIRRRRKAAPGLACAVLGVAVLAAATAAGAGESPVLAGRAPLGDAELAAIRGGFVTHDGLEITFGMRMRVNIDQKLELVAEFRPGSKGHRGKKGRAFEASFNPVGGGGPGTRIRRGEDGAIAIATGEGDLEIADSPTVPIPGGTAELVSHDDGLTLSADGDLPLTLEEGPDGVALRLGSEETTLVEDRLGLEGLNSRVANRRSGADVVHDAILDVDVHNFSRLAEVRKKAARIGRLQGLVNRGIVQFGGRR